MLDRDTAEETQDAHDWQAHRQEDAQVRQPPQDLVEHDLGTREPARHQVVQRLSLFFVRDRPAEERRDQEEDDDQLHDRELEEGPLREAGHGRDRRRSGLREGPLILAPYQEQQDRAIEEPQHEVAPAPSRTEQLAAEDRPHQHGDPPVISARVDAGRSPRVASQRVLPSAVFPSYLWCVGQL
jgi:hypothetical protein